MSQCPPPEKTWNFQFLLIISLHEEGYYFNIIVSSLFITTHVQTVKCLLIYPNPDSALNEEAGKLLQERYDDYSSHARMMTEIHARPPKSSSSCSSTTASSFSHTSSSRTSPKELRCFAVTEGGSETTCESTSTSGGNGATSQGKKRPLSDKSLGSTVNGAEKKKKDKKKALKRL